MRRVTALLLGASALTLAACGGGSSGGGYVEPKGPPVKTLRMEAGNLFFKPKTETSPAGIIRIDLVNVQTGVHNLVLEGVPGFHVEVSGKGAEDSEKVELKAGTYTYYCSLPGHRAAGMEGTLTVR